MVHKAFLIAILFSYGTYLHVRVLSNKNIVFRHFCLHLSINFLWRFLVVTPWHHLVTDSSKHCLLPCETNVSPYLIAGYTSSLNCVCKVELVIQGRFQGFFCCFFSKFWSTPYSVILFFVHCFTTNNTHFIHK